MKELQLGTIGSGVIVHDILDNVRRVEGIRLEAVYSRAKDKGQALAQEYGIAWLPSDFKKRDGYKRSLWLSNEYHLYRQNYCGCEYSRL